MQIHRTRNKLFLAPTQPVTYIYLCCKSSVIAILPSEVHMLVATSTCRTARQGRKAMMRSSIPRRNLIILRRTYGGRIAVPQYRRPLVYGISRLADGYLRKINGAEDQWCHLFSGQSAGGTGCCRIRMSAGGSGECNHQSGQGEMGGCRH